MDDIAARGGKFLKTDIRNRQVSQLIGIAQGIIADGNVNDCEVNFLHKWLVANAHVQDNPLIEVLVNRVDEILTDGIIDDDERAELDTVLKKLVSNDFELGEVLKSSTLPLCDPAPTVAFEDRTFCLTGSFCFGIRKKCEKAIEERGGVPKSGITRKTDFLVIGEYVTDSWKHEVFGRKILKAVDVRGQGFPLSIISEKHWSKHLDL